MVGIEASLGRYAHKSIRKILIKYYIMIYKFSYNNERV